MIIIIKNNHVSILNINDLHVIAVYSLDCVHLVPIYFEINQLTDKWDSKEYSEPSSEFTWEWQKPVTLPSAVPNVV